MEKNVSEQLLSLSIVKELKDEISRLENELSDEKNKFEQELKIAQNNTELKNRQKCWLDDLSCPYGNPEGKFQLRPTDVCRQGGCYKIADVESELEDMIFGYNIQTTVSEYCGINNPITISVALLNILENEDNELDDDEKVLVKAVADMLNGGTGDYNPRIYYAEDLEEEL